LAEHLVFDGALAGDNLILAPGGSLTDFPRTTGRNGGQALRFDGSKSWTFYLPEQRTVSFWLSSDFSNRQSAVANISGHNLGISATKRFTLGGQDTSSGVVANAWYQLLLRRTGQSIDLYLNGKLFQTLQASNSSVIINPTASFIGKLDDFRRYARPLDSFEVDSLFRDESSGQGLSIYQPSPTASQGTLPLIARIRDDVNTIDLISGRQWTVNADYQSRVGLFEFVRGNYTWNAAYQDALNRGGTLAWWNSQTELNQILSLLAISGQPGAWINATDEGHEGVWKYRTPSGELAFPFAIPWAPGQPDNFQGAENWAHFFKGQTSVNDLNNQPGGWNNADYVQGYVLQRDAGTRVNGNPILLSSGLSFSGGTTIACRFKGLAPTKLSYQILSLLDVGDGDPSIEASAVGLRLTSKNGFFDWPLPESLGDRQHVAALVLHNATSLTVYLDGVPLFSRPTTAVTPANFKALMTENGDIRAYARPLSLPEVASVSAELAPRVQYFTLSQAAAIPSLTKTNETVTATGGTVQTELLLAAGVPWKAASSNSWLNFVTGANARTNLLSATGPQVISIFAGENNTTDPRQGSATIAGFPFTLVQGGRTVTLNPLSAGTARYGDNVNAVVRETGGAVLVGILPEAGAAWTLRYAKREDASWIVPTPTNAVGNKDVLFAISPYNSPLASRTAVFYVADKEIRITQRGYTATVTPSATSFPGDGGQGQVQVNVPPSAFWEAVALSPWITIVTGQTANGTGSVIFKVASNTGPARFGTIIVAGEAIQLAQAARVVSSRPRLALIGTTLSLFGAAGTTYFIERSLDLKTWEVVTEVTASGESQAADLTIQANGQSAQFFRSRSRDKGEPVSGM
jgi:hypothetical protein